MGCLLLGIELHLDLFDLGLLSNIVLMELSYLLLLLVDGLNVPLVLLGELTNLSLHPVVSLFQFLILISLECLLLVVYLLQVFLLLLQLGHLALQKLKLVFLLHYLVDVVFVVQVLSKFVYRYLVLVYLYLLFPQFVL